MALPSVREIEQVARDVLRELTGSSQGEVRRELARERGLDRSFVGEAEVRAARARGEKTLRVPAGAIVTPLARDVAWDAGIEIIVQGGGAAGAGTAASAAADPEAGGPAPLEGGGLALGADHGGFALKEALRAHLEARGVAVHDVGTHRAEPCDYPDLAARVAQRVALGEAAWGILVDGAGIGSCMAANKVPGVLAATCHDERTARNSREHNGANVLCLGAGSLDEAAARRVVDAWIETPFAGGRHGRRVAKIVAIERGFVRS